MRENKNSRQWAPSEKLWVGLKDPVEISELSRRHVIVEPAYFFWRKKQLVGHRNHLLSVSLQIVACVRKPRLMASKQPVATPLLVFLLAAL